MQVLCNLTYHASFSPCHRFFSFLWPVDRWYHTYADIVPFKTPDMGKIIGCEMRRTNLGVLAWSPLIPGFRHKSDPFFSSPYCLWVLIVVKWDGM